MIGYCKEAPSAVGVFHVYPEGGAAAVCEHVAAGLRRPVQLQQPAERSMSRTGQYGGCESQDVTSTPQQ